MTRREALKAPGKKRRKPGAARRSAATQPTLFRRFFRWSAIGLGGLLLVSLALTLPLRWIDPPATAFMLADKSGRVPVLHDWVEWSDVGSAAPLAVVAAEDQRFLEHSGFDFDSIAKSIRTAEQGGRLRGASTISQQLSKNLYLWNGRSYLRKGLEAWLTLFLELTLPKRRILEIYLNVIELGPGIYGVGAGSRYFFGMPADRLSDRQAALLAAVLPNPHRLRVDQPSDYVQERQRWIASQVERLRRESWLGRL